MALNEVYLKRLHDAQTRLRAAGAVSAAAPAAGN
jgi:hypothetical protein